MFDPIGFIAYLSARQDQEAPSQEEALRKRPQARVQHLWYPSSPQLKMKLFTFLLTFSFLHSVGLVSGRDADADGLDWDAGIPRPTPEPLLYREEFKRGPLLMETNLGYPRNGTSRRDLALGARQVCDRHGPWDSIDAAVSIPAVQATFLHVPLQKNTHAAPRRILYVVPHSK
jgi:hypothetical protein